MFNKLFSSKSEQGSIEIVFCVLLFCAVVAIIGYLVINNLGGEVMIQNMETLNQTLP